MSNFPPENPASPSPIDPSSAGSPRPSASNFSAGSFNAKKHVAPGTGFHTVIGYIVSSLGLIVVLSITMGFAILLAPILYFAHIFNQKKTLAKLHGSALQIGPNQFPDIHKMIGQTAAAMGMKVVPESYLYEDNTQNAGAAKVKGKKILLLTDDMIYGAMTTKNAKVLQFVIAHELAHHQLGHSGLLRGYVSQAYKPLSRLDEFSCDAVAAAVINDQAASAKALALLAVGPQLLPKVNLESLVAQAKEVADNKQSKKSEGALSHPLLLRRYARVMGVKMKV